MVIFGYFQVVFRQLQLFLNILNLFCISFNHFLGTSGYFTLFLDFFYIFQFYFQRFLGTFVLNGFIYSLIGLYDAWKLCGDEQKAKELYLEGLSSLKKMLPLFDAGSGSFYDLRHASLNGQVNKPFQNIQSDLKHLYFRLHQIQPVGTIMLFIFINCCGCI